MENNFEDNDLKKKGFLIFPGLEQNHIHIIIFAISSLLRTALPSWIGKIEGFAKLENECEYFKEICYFDMLTNIVGDFSVAFYILIKYIKKKNKKLSMTTEGVKTRKNMFRIFLFILPLIALIDIAAQLCLYIFAYFNNSVIILGIGKKTKIIFDEDLFFIVGIDIAFRYLFSRIILKGYFYKHHYLSMCLNGFGFLPLTIIGVKNLINHYNNNTNEDILFPFISYIILYVIRTILYSLEDVCNKIALNKLLLRPYELMFYKALFQLIPIIIISAIAFSGENFSSYVTNYLTGIHLLGRLIYRLIFIICNIFRTISLITIIEKLNPNHLSILKSIEFIFLFIYILIVDKLYKNSINVIFESISCLILLLGALIHNELIVINKWGFLECTVYYKSMDIPDPLIDNIIDDKNDKSDDNNQKDPLTGDSISQED